MTTAIEGLARRLIAARPVTVLVSYEVPGVPGLQVISLPDSPAVRSGHVDALVEQVFPARVRPALD